VSLTAFSTSDRASSAIIWFPDDRWISRCYHFVAKSRDRFEQKPGRGGIGTLDQAIRTFDQDSVLDRLGNSISNRKILNQKPEAGSKNTNARSFRSTR
jgi:hypothetical protein